MRIAIAAALASAGFMACAEAAEIGAGSRIQSVIVFPSGAEVVRAAKLKLERGEHTLVFNDLPAGAVQGSIRVEGKATGRLEIGSVDTKRVFVPRAEGEAEQSERKRLEDEIDRLNDEKGTLEAQVQAAETQKSLIANFTQLPTRPGPAEGAGRAEDWPAILALIGSASAEAQRLLLEAKVKIRETDRTLEDHKKKLAALAPRREERTEVKVYVAAEVPLEADISVRYQVKNAMWTPLYDARLSSGAKTVAPKLSLTRRASITQRTGESWDDVAITLSTTRPTAGAAAPELKPLTVDFEPEYKPKPMAAPGPGRERSAGKETMAAAPPEPPADAAAGEGLGVVARQEEDVAERGAEIVAAPFQALFVVPGRLTVPQTGEAKRVQLLEESIEPQLSVTTVPKEDAKAYLYAKFVLPKGSPLLAGAVSLFRDGTFVGESRLPVLSPGEEHDLGFGVDDLVRVRHAVLEDKRGETGLITTSRTDSRNFRITVKNMHERAIGLTVIDQIPVSQNQDIKVELNARTPPTKENVDDQRGVLAWESKLDPDQELVLEFGYKVTWPSAKAIVYGR
jgi:uncharacterized protein (TIGR02231 family)